jgi:hypothetical protein
MRLMFGLAAMFCLAWMCVIWADGGLKDERVGRAQNLMLLGIALLFAAYEFPLY